MKLGLVNFATQPL